MASNSRAVAASFDPAKKALIAVIGALALFFVYEFVTPYFTWSEDAYGPYYWPHRISLIFHVLGGSVALLVGIFQLWSGLNNKGINYHRITGRIYLSAVAVGSIGAISLSFVSDIFGLTFAVGLFCLALAWISTTSMAFFCIKKRNYRLHKQWMIRSYIVTFSFVMFRIITDYVPYEEWWGVSRMDISNAIIWAVWVLPLLAYEILAQRREI